MPSTNGVRRTFPGSRAALERKVASVDRLLAPTVRNALADPAGLALVWGYRRWTHAELEVEVLAAARKLAGLGLGAGARVALVSWNRPEVVFLLHAAARVGLTLAPLNARLTDFEIAALLERLRPRALVADAQGAARSLDPGLARDAMIALDEPPDRGWRAWTALPTRPGEVGESVEPGHVHTVLFSSGTSGRPKGIMLPWRSHLFSALTSAVPLRASARDRWLLSLPMFHVGGWSIAVRGAVLGAAVELHPRFDAQATAGALTAGEVSLASVVAAGLDAVLNRLPPAPSRFTPRAILLGGGPAPPALLERAALAGFKILTTYGLTEASSQVTTLDLDDPTDPSLSAGKPLPLTTVRIVDQDRRPLPAGEEGEIEVRGPTLLAGYLDEPSATDLPSSGWLRTGDFGRLDQAGRLTVLARREDLIVSGGENVYPAEVEGILQGLPGVADAVVLAIPHQRWGQVGVAVVEVRPGVEVDPGRLLEQLAARLAAFKVPERIVIVGALPRTGAGKVDRRAARELVGPAGASDGQTS